MASPEMVPVTNEKLLAVVEALAIEIWREHYPGIIGEDQVEYMLGRFQSKEAISEQVRDEGYLYFLISAKKDIYVGYVAVQPLGSELQLSKLYVRAAERGKGYGKAAIDFVEKIAGDMNFKKISLTVNKKNKASIDIYKKSGFKIKEPVVTEIGEGYVKDDYRMEKEIV